MLTLLMLLTSLAGAAPCPSFTKAEKITEQVNGLVEPIAAADASAEAKLNEIEATLTSGCVRDVLPKATLASFFLAQGAYELRPLGDVEQAKIYLKQAAALSATVDARYGDLVFQEYRKVEDAQQGKTVLNLDTIQGYERIYVDGQLIVNTLRPQVRPGVHYVQWFSTDSGWGAEMVSALPYAYETKIKGPTSPGIATPSPKNRSFPPLMLFVAGGYTASVAPRLDTEFRLSATRYAPALQVGAELGETHPLTIAARLTPRAEPMSRVPTTPTLPSPRLPPTLWMGLGLLRREHQQVDLGLLVTQQPMIELIDVVVSTDEGEPFTREAPRYTSSAAAGAFVRLAIDGDLEQSQWSAYVRAEFSVAPRDTEAFAATLGGSISRPVGSAVVVLRAESTQLYTAGPSAGLWFFPQVYGGVSWSL